MTTRYIYIYINDLGYDFEGFLTDAHQAYLDDRLDDSDFDSLQSMNMRFAHYGARTVVTDRDQIMLDNLRAKVY